MTTTTKNESPVKRIPEANDDDDAIVIVANKVRKEREEEPKEGEALLRPTGHRSRMLTVMKKERRSLGGRCSWRNQLSSLYSTTSI